MRTWVRTSTLVVVAISLLLVVAGLWLAWLHRDVTGIEAPVPGPTRIFLPTQLASSLVWTAAALVMLRRPEILWASICAGAALSHAIAAVAFEWAIRAFVVDPTVPGGDVAVWFLSWVLPVEVLALNWMALSLPDGRLGEGRLRRWSNIALGATAAGVIAGMIVSYDGDGTSFVGATNPLGGGLPISAAIVPAFLAPTGLITLGVLWVRWRRSAGETRVAMRMIVVISLVGLVIPALFVARPEIAATAAQVAGALQVLAMIAVVLRHRLFGIDALLERALLYSVLVGVLLVVYASIVAIGDQVADRVLGPAAAVAVALAALPLHRWLSGVIRRFVYGDRDRPDRLVAAVVSSTGLTASPHEMLQYVVEEIATGLRLSWLTLTDAAGMQLATTGVAHTTATSPFPLVYRGRPVGSLTTEPRTGEDELGDADVQALTTLCSHLAPLVDNVAGAAALRESRDRLVLVREEERRRLRRDLHDGLGSVLTGVALTADAARNVVRSDPDRATELLGAARAELSGAIAEIRRLVEGLRPPALDDLGLIGSIRQHGERFPALSIEVRSIGDLAGLPAAVEVAAYRIATEGITNAARHSSASRVAVTLERSRSLTVTVRNDGASTAAWEPGVGLTSMNERAAELGGTVTAGPIDEGGGEVVADLPVEP